MRDKTHKDFIEAWARYVRDNPNSWKKEHKEFIDAQIIKSREFYERLAKTPEGGEKIRKLRELKNLHEANSL